MSHQTEGIGHISDSRDGSFSKDGSLRSSHTARSTESNSREEKLLRLGRLATQFGEQENPVSALPGDHALVKRLDSENQVLLAKCNALRRLVDIREQAAHSTAQILKSALSDQAHAAGRHLAAAAALEQANQETQRLSVEIAIATRGAAELRDQLNVALTRENSLNAALSNSGYVQKELNQQLDAALAEVSRLVAAAEEAKLIEQHNTARLTSELAEASNLNETISAEATARISTLDRSLEHANAELSCERLKASKIQDEVNSLKLALDGLLEAQEKKLAAYDKELADGRLGLVEAVKTQDGLNASLEHSRIILASDRDAAVMAALDFSLQMRAAKETSARLQAHIDELEAHLSLVCKTFSWRITAPLRAVRRFMGRK